jgi:hypothetical protein
VRRIPCRGRLVVALALAFLGVLALSACADDDPFAGLYWEPSTGRRVEIRVDGDAYQFIYGAGKRPFAAVREGDELRIAEPLGGVTVVRPGDAAGTLQLSTAGKTSVLEPVPQHQ